LLDLDYTIKEVERDIEYFDEELRFLEERKARLDERGVADLIQAQTQLRARRSDANQGLIRLRDAHILENKKVQRATASLQAAEARHEDARQRLRELEVSIDRLERQIVDEAAKIAACAVEFTQEPASKDAAATDSQSS